MTELSKKVFFFFKYGIIFKNNIVKICIRQCGVLMFSERFPSNVWENIFVIYLERKAVEFYVGFN